MNNAAVILAAGAGTRMQCDKSKLLFDLCGKTVLERSVAAFAPLFDTVLVVCREGDLDAFQKILKAYDVRFCSGGNTRQESVTNAVNALDSCDLIAIHDGARPLITKDEIERTLALAKEYGAAAVGVPLKDTIKIVDRNHKILETPDRSTLISIRTPQIFDFSLYQKALAKANADGCDFTDDCAVMEYSGHEVYVCLGAYDNIKITTPEDVPLAESIIKRRQTV